MPPADLDFASLTGASGAKLDFWIDAANKDLPKKVLIKTGKVDVRRQRIADYYHIDLSAAPATATVGPVSRDTEINNRQWEHLRKMGAEWAKQDAAGLPFKLVADPDPARAHPTLLPSVQSAITETLAGAMDTLSSSSSSVADNGQEMDDETVQALINCTASRLLGHFVVICVLPSLIRFSPPHTMEDPTDPLLPTIPPSIPVVLRSPWHAAAHAISVYPAGYHPHPHTCLLSLARIARFGLSSFAHGEHVERAWSPSPGVPQINVDVIEQSWALSAPLAPLGSVPRLMVPFGRRHNTLSFFTGKKTPKRSREDESPLDGHKKVRLH
ncbi:hypothetical protein C8R47DRAFT_1224759 [Mycena vitilis]|nr:hypothetical protein C8R47DRAFT_1224759 [Mycena vitilis]